MLTPRREKILKIIVQEYINKGVPVASETISRDFHLGVSPATVRNDMAYLEEMGYIARPHISAGAVPLHKAYRHYVEFLIKDVELSPMERHFIGSLFQDAELEFEKCTKLAASLLARSIQTMAVVTPPKAPKCRFKHLELIKLQEFLVLLILVLQRSKLVRHFLPMSESVGQEELSRIANQLNVIYDGLSSAEIMAKELELSPFENQITEIVISLMAAEDEPEYDEPYFEGLRLMFSQSKFVSTSQLLDLMELIKERGWLSNILSQGLVEGQIRVVIGEETQEEPLRNLSLIFTRYGIPKKIGGAIGVIGPTRMDYGRAISSVRYLSELLSGFVAEVYR